MSHIPSSVANYRKAHCPQVVPKARSNYEKNTRMISDPPPQREKTSQPRPVILRIGTPQVEDSAFYLHFELVPRSRFFIQNIGILGPFTHAGRATRTRHCPQGTASAAPYHGEWKYQKLYPRREERSVAEKGESKPVECFPRDAATLVSLPR